MDSHKAWQTTVGHEITHVFEGTEFYNELRTAVQEYARRAGTLGKATERIKSLYSNIENADLDAELTAELIGEYLFTDEAFVRNLSTEHRNVFQKIYDEIKYLAKVVTAGSKEARQLEKVKHIFDKMYRESEVQKNTVIENGVKYALSDIKDITPSDSQILANIQEVAQMDAVYTIDESKLEKSGKDFKELYGGYFETWGENIHTDLFGDVAAKKSSIRSEIRHGSTSEKIASIEAIPSVLNNGKIVDWIKKSSESFRIVVAAPISIGKQPYIMGVMLQRDSQNQRLYIHDVVIEKEASAPMQEHLLTTGPRNENDNLFLTSILQKISDVKRNLNNSGAKTDKKTNVNTQKSLSPLGDDFPIRPDLRGTPASELRYEPAPVNEAVLPSESGGEKNRYLDESDWDSYMRTGKTLHTRNKKTRMFESGKNPILTTIGEIKQFILDAISGKAIGEVRAYGIVGSDLANAITAVNSSVETEGRYIELNADDLREAYKRHSEPKERGDIALSEEDFARIPEYLDEFDGVTSVDKYNGKVEIHLYKELDDGYVRILTVSSKERNSLIVSKLVGVSKEKFEAKYSKKIERNAGSPRGQDASIPSTKARLTASVLSDTIISQTPPNVNTPKSLSPLGDDFPIRSDLRGTPASELKYEDFEAEKKNLNKKLYEIRSARRETSAQYREAIFTLQAAFPKIRDGCFYKCVKL